MKRFGYRVVCILLVVLVTVAFAETTPATDEFANYQTDFGYFYTISEVIQKDEANISEGWEDMIAHPGVSITVGNIRVEVSEILTDGIVVWANCEVSLLEDGALLRPLFCVDSSDPYYTLLEYYDMPVYFVGCMPSLTAGKYTGYEELGISNDQATMNLIGRSFRFSTADSYLSLDTEADTVEVWLSILIYTYIPSNTTVSEQHIELTIDIPLCDGIEICSFSAADVHPDVNIRPPLFAFVQTPYQTYFASNGIDAIDDTQPIVYWSVSDEMNSFINNHTSFMSIPAELTYTLSTHVNNYGLLYQYILIRDGDQYVVESQVYP